MRIRKLKTCIIGLILIFMMILAGLTGCGKKPDSSGTSQGSGTEEFSVPAESSVSSDLSLIEKTGESHGSGVLSPAEDTGESYGSGDLSLSESTMGSDRELTDVSGTADLSEEESRSTGDKYERPESKSAAIDRDGIYTSKDDVALYLHTYGELPKNFITKKQAKKLGWSGGSLEPYAPGKCIGGDYFGNYEGQLPEKKGREYHECDIDTLGKSKRGAKRIIFSNDGLIYYTGDHYEHFELLYGEK